MMKRPQKTKSPDVLQTVDDGNPLASSGMADAGNMDKIRDILFGNQAKDYEKRFDRMESKLTQEAQVLKEELLNRIDSLESYIKQEISDINDRIKNESEDRKNGFDALNKKILADEENLAKKSTELREQILEQSKQLSAEIIKKYDQATNNLNDSVFQLNDTKVNRSDLSGFFLEIAMRLSDDGGSGPTKNQENK